MRTTALLLMRKYLSWIAVVSFTVGWSCHQERAIVRRPPPIMLIFADVTNTLSEEEHQSVCTIVRCLIRTAKPRSRVYVYPITARVEEANLLARVWKVPSLDDVGAEHDIAREGEQRALQAVSEIRRLYRDVVNQPSSIRERTCIFDALRRAESILNEDPDAPAEIYLISDMVEDCNSSIDNRSIRLNKEDLKEEISKIASGDKLLSLKQASVTIFLPRSDSTAPRKEVRPPAVQRREFWQTVLRRCDAARIRFNPEVPVECGELAPPAQ